MTTAGIMDIHLPNKSLVDEVLWGRFVRRLIDRPTFQTRYGCESSEEQYAIAEQLFDQWIEFMRFIAVAGGSFSPSEEIDEPWHVALEYTLEYDELTASLTGGWKIHHSPSDIPGVDYGTGNPGRTVAAMRVHGFRVVDRFWPSQAECCGCQTSNDVVIDAA